MALPHSVPPVLAVGGHLKNTICVTRGAQAHLSQHLGDLDNAATLGFFERTIKHLLNILEVEPVAVAHDPHPDFLSTRHAESLGLPTIPVQHHHAHVAAVLAEHGRTGPTAGLALDGFGLGEDGTSRGGGTPAGGRRPLPAPRPFRSPWPSRAETWRRGSPGAWRHRPCSALAGSMKSTAASPRCGNTALLVQMLERGFNSPETTSCGRWFDAACGLLGVRTTSGFEGEAAMVLELLVTQPQTLAQRLDHLERHARPAAAA